MKKVIFTLLVFLFSLSSFAIRDVIKVGIYWGDRPTSSLISVNNGAYKVIADGKLVKELSANQTLVVRVSEGKVQLSSGGNSLGEFNNVGILRKLWGSAFSIRGLSPKMAKRTYNDNLHLSVYRNRLKLVNDVYIEHYIAGVVEAESGSKETYEYYKVQAIIARTYVLTNINKYSKYGFNVCDRVNSQVYKGLSTRNLDIVRAVNDTKGLVLVDSDINLIQAVFHSNSGGQTVNSEDAWSQPLSYLRSVSDTFSKGMPHFNWDTYVTKDKWLSYFKTKHNYPIEDSSAREFLLSYCPIERERYLSPMDTNILLKTIRKDWGLRSTYFTIKEEENKIYIVGMGFGHGVGLSQEGAMRMAESGMAYNKILHYYYRDTHLIHLSALDFFRGE